MRLISLMWVMLAGMSFSIGVLGIFLPLLPTTVFMLIAIYCASRGSPRFEAWIRSRHYVGPLLVTWEQERAIPKRAKIFAVCTIALSAIITVWSLGPGWLSGAVVALLMLIALWLATRPEPSSHG
ncbi:membrane protein [Halomonas campaniensis]|uniref:YbaN family protein n=1 Tax=Halomonas sp. IOP_6 TaxID=2876583 RepID=UPI00049ADF59|nr:MULTISPECIES: YbaN family protein [unclassified Halomonas]AIA74014.1 membrane protein [Halomonas campaniensis]MCD6005380.1 YbaN family protein [Halomonas sp. IOP_6]